MGLFSSSKKKNQNGDKHVESSSFKNMVQGLDLECSTCTLYHCLDEPEGVVKITYPKSTSTSEDSGDNNKYCPRCGRRRSSSKLKHCSDCCPKKAKRSISEKNTDCDPTTSCAYPNCCPDICQLSNNNKDPKSQETNSEKPTDEELKMSNLNTCSCDKRNGLQDDCPMENCEKCGPNAQCHKTDINREKRTCCIQAETLAMNQQSCCGGCSASNCPCSPPPARQSCCQCCTPSCEACFPPPNCPSPINIGQVIPIAPATPYPLYTPPPLVYVPQDGQQDEVQWAVETVPCCCTC